MAVTLAKRMIGSGLREHLELGGTPRRGPEKDGSEH